MEFMANKLIKKPKKRSLLAYSNINKNQNKMNQYGNPK